MKLQKQAPIILLFLILCSCQEELDFLDPAFIKVYGLDGWNEGSDMIEAKNGDLILVGGFTRTFYLENYEVKGGGILLEQMPTATS